MTAIIAGKVAQLRRSEILECLEGLLGASPEPLRLIVRDIQGLGGPIDAVACDAAGTPVLIGIATPDGAADPLGFPFCSSFSRRFLPLRWQAAKDTA